MKTDFFARAAWLDPTWVMFVAYFLLVGNILAISALLFDSPHMITPAGTPVGTDFMNVWSAGKLVLQGNAGAAYDYDLHYAVQRGALPWPAGQDVQFYGWHYPPVFLLIAAMLAILPYGPALFAWMTVTLPVYLLAVRKIVPGREGLIVALAFPGVLDNLLHGQNGFLTCGLMGLGLLALNTRPVLAGVFFGLMAYKPQFGLLLPLALLAGMNWRAFFSASVTVITIMLLSWLTLGTETWLAFFDSLTLTKHTVLEQGFGGHWARLQSLFGAVRLLGGGIGAAYLAQGIATALATAAVIWVWRKTPEIALRGSALVLGALLATPYVLDYDLVLLALPIAWICALGLRQGFYEWEKMALVAAWFLPMVSRLVAIQFSIPLGPLVLAALLVLVLRRTAIAAGNNKII